MGGSKILFTTDQPIFQSQGEGGCYCLLNDSSDPTLLVFICGFSWAFSSKLQYYHIQLSVFVLEESK